MGGDPERIPLQGSWLTRILAMAGWRVPETSQLPKRDPDRLAGMTVSQGWGGVRWCPVWLPAANTSWHTSIAGVHRHEGPKARLQGHPLHALEREGGCLCQQGPTNLCQLGGDHGEHLKGRGGGRWDYSMRRSGPVLGLARTWVRGGSSVSVCHSPGRGFDWLGGL